MIIGRLQGMSWTKNFHKLHRLIVFHRFKFSERSKRGLNWLVIWYKIIQTETPSLFSLIFMFDFIPEHFRENDAFDSFSWTLLAEHLRS